MVSHCDSSFAVWNMLSSLKEQASNNVERELIVDESKQTCYMVQGNNSLMVNSESHLDDYASSSDDHDSSMDTHALNEELSIFCENLLSKYKVLKARVLIKKEKMKISFQNSF